MAGRGVRGLGVPRERGVLRLPAARHRGQEEDPRPERGQAVRHRGACRVPAARMPGHAGAPDDAQLVAGHDGTTAAARAAGSRRGWRRVPGGARPRRRCRLLAALDTVRDPELDEPITSLGFVAVVHRLPPVARRRSRLRLPTYFCAPNFAYLMVADAYDAVAALPGVHTARWSLTITSPPTRSTAGWRRRPDSPGPSTARRSASCTSCAPTFLRKAVHGRDRPGVPAAAGAPAPTRRSCGSMTLGEVPPSAALRPAACGAGRARAARRRRRPAARSTRPPACSRRDGVPLQLRRARLDPDQHRGNGSICRGMLRPPVRHTRTRSRRTTPVKAVRLHAFHQQPVIDEVQSRRSADRSTSS